jgi:O-antigen ligase
MKPLYLLAFGLPFLLAVRWAAARPARTILPIYAGTLPIASVVQLSVPLPPPFNTLSSILGAGVILSCLAHLALVRRGRIPGVSVALWLLFLSWISLTIFWASDPPAALRTVELAVPLVMLMVLVSAIDVDGKDLDVLRSAIIIGGIGVGIYALFLVLTGSRLPTHGVSQRFSLATNPRETDPNILAASLLLPLSLSLERLFLGGSRWGARRPWWLLGAAGAFLTTVAILLTGSRGGALSAVVAGGLTVLACCRLAAVTVLRRLAVAIVSIGIVVAVLSLLGPGAFGRSPVGRFVSSEPVQRLTAVQGSSGRGDIWKTGVHACRLHCAFGAGVGNFAAAYNDSMPFAGATRNVGLDRPAHNVFLGLAVETGLAGLVLFGLALVADWVSLSRARVSAISPSLKPALVGVLIANFFLSTLWYKYFWLVLTMIRATEGAAQAASSVDLAAAPVSEARLQPQPAAI